MFIHVYLWVFMLIYVYLCCFLCIYVYDLFSMMFGICWDDHENICIEHASSTPILRRGQEPAGTLKKNYAVRVPLYTGNTRISMIQCGLSH